MTARSVTPLQARWVSVFEIVGAAVWEAETGTEFLCKYEIGAHYYLPQLRAADYRRAAFTPASTCGQVAIVQDLNGAFFKIQRFQRRHIDKINTNETSPITDYSRSGDAGVFVHHLNSARASTKTRCDFRTCNDRRGGHSTRRSRLTTANCLGCRARLTMKRCVVPKLSKSASNV